jgi:hypothetical protein
VPGIRISELLPRTASLAHRWAVIRSVYHTASPIHETGYQLLQTGQLSRPGCEHPHVGAVLAQRLGPRRAGMPPFVVLGGALGNTGVDVSHGQRAGFLGGQYDPVTWTSPMDAMRDRYGATAFGDLCLHACRFVEAGVRFVVVNMFDSLYDRVTWDCHADRRCLASTLDDYRRTLCPTFDAAFTGLLDDLHQRGILDSTLVVAAGEFGRTPCVNAGGGRDHWPGVWSILCAGGGVPGGQVIGASDKFGREPGRRPVLAEDIAATICQFFHINPATRIAGPEGEVLALTDGRPVRELLG